MRTLLVGAAGLVLLAGLMGTASDRSQAADDDKNWGTIKGRIVWSGDNLPDPAEIKVEKDGDHCLSKGKLFSEEWVVNKDNKGIRWVFVWLAPEPGGAVKALPIHPDLKEIKDKTVVMDQPCCQFVPHALGMREGQTLIVKNSAPILHNVNYTGHPAKNPGKNEAVAPKTQLEIANLKADDFPVSVACNVHGWMQAKVRVFNNPYFAVTDADGKFEIKQAPAGDWRLRIWSDAGWRGGAAGRMGEKVTVKAGGVTDLGDLGMKKTD